MALNYNLKYKKLNFFHKVLTSKEGEVIIDRMAFRLKGKGAKDQGETIYFSDIKSLNIVGNDQLTFSTYKKEQFILSSFSNLFESFLKDFYRVRNEYLAENLFLKVGMLYKEYEGHVEVVDNSGNLLNKGFSKLQLYEGSMLIIPEENDCFAFNYNFLKSHEFDEDDYMLKLYLENGETIHISKLGTNFEDAQEALELLLGKMYQRVVTHLNELLPNLNAEQILKLASTMREGKGISLPALKKIDEDLPKTLEDILFANNKSLYDKSKFLQTLSSDKIFHLGFLLYNKMDVRDLQIKSWFLCSIPAQNLIAIAIISNPKDSTVYFFRAVTEPGDFSEKLAEKILDINQSMLLLRFDLTPLHKDKRELKKSRYRTALRKISYLRQLRKSYVGKSSALELETFKKDCDFVFKKAADLQKIQATVAVKLPIKPASV